MTMDLAVLQRIEDFYDVVPRSVARAEVHGPLTLFVREGAGWPFYARPTHGGGVITVADVVAARARQRELGVPEAFEWVEQLAPTMTDAARGAGLGVRHCPLLVLDTFAPSRVAADLRVLEADAPDLALVEAVAQVGFGAQIGTGIGTAGVAERDQAAASADPARLDQVRAGLRDGASAKVAAYGPDGGPISCGGYQHALGVVEIVGVATLPAARRQGLGGAVTVRLAQLALERGLGTVFLSAQDDDVACVYERIGFTRVATAGLAEPA